MSEDEEKGAAMVQAGKPLARLMFLFEPPPGMTTEEMRRKSRWALLAGVALQVSVFWSTPYFMRQTGGLGKRVMSHWPSQKFTRGSYTCPLVGQVTTMLEHCATPELDGKLLFAGEHTSADFSGFMCGGIESGNRAAKEALGEG